MNENEPTTEQESKPEEAKPATEVMETEDDEQAAMQMALQMSMQEDNEESKEESKSEGEQQQFQDPQFVNELLGSLPGVDPSDPAIQNALRNINESAGGDKD